MGDPEIYVMYPDVMPPLTRRNYVRNRTQSVLTYILEYRQMEAMINEGIYDENYIQQRLRAVFGRVDAIRQRIDEALENDNMHKRRRDMHVLPLPKNFPQPQPMGRSPVPTWIRWIREESEQIVGDLEEEMQWQKENSAGKGEQYDRPAKSCTETMFGIQQRSNFSHHPSPQQAVQVNCIPQQQPTGEEFDPYRTVRSFHR